MKLEVPRLSTRLRGVAVASIVAGCALLLPGPAAAYPGCAEGSPASSVPQSLWAGLAPAAAAPFADTTNYNGNQLPNHRYPLWSALDVEGDTLFATYTEGFALFDVSDPANITRDAIYDCRSSSYPRPVEGFSEEKHFFADVDAPAGRSDVAVAVGRPVVGLVVWKVGDGEATAVYQDSEQFGPGKSLEAVFTAEIGGKLWAFAAASEYRPGIHHYDVSAALARTSPCGENANGNVQCPGIYKGQIGDAKAYLHLASVAKGDGSFLLGASGGYSGSPGLDVYEVRSNGSGGISTAKRVVAFGGEAIQGIAMWKDGGKYYLAVRTLLQAQIYDITSCASSLCSTLAGKEVGPALVLNNASNFSGWQSITFSRAGSPTTGKPFLYFGNDTMCHSGLRKEWLYDVSDPAKPVDVVGTKTVNVTGSDGGQGTVDYWSYYYSNNPSGFSQVMPREGQFSGNYFYRAARTIMDAHKLQSIDPSIGLNGPATAYQDTDATFAADAANCTPASTWSWDAGPDATITGTGSTVAIRWSTLGNKTVTVTNSACGSADDELTVVVNDPAPVIGSVTASPTTAFVCQPITFTATGVDGKPPLTRAWRVEPAAGGSPTGLASTTDTAVWTPPSTTAAGQYTGFLEVSGTGTPSETEKSATVTLNALPTLPVGGAFTPAASPASPEFGTLTLSVAAPGATEWNWDYGNGYTGWINDPTDGPSHSHTYTQTDVDDVCGGTLPCVFDVRVKIRNCVEAERESAVLPVTIQKIDPLEIVQFAAACRVAPCSFEVGQAISFVLEVEGTPTGYAFDWDGNGTFEDTSTAPSGGAVTHAYNAGGSYSPVVRVIRGSETKELAHDPLHISSVTTPKVISISGPGSGKVGTSMTFVASAQGCSPTSNAWTWTTSGGSGSSSSNQISISWSAAGTKNVTATNSACSGITGSRVVSITGNDPDPDPDPNPRASLVPKISVTPGTPQVGQKVTFDGSASEGAPENYLWTIEGKTYTTAKAEHTFTTNGKHEVFLEISKANPLCILGVCSQSTSKTVTVGGAAPDPDPEQGDNGCTGAAADDENKLCLGSGRFEVEVDFTDQHNGTTGRGQAVKFPGSERTGFFWFFRPTNFELVLKILDGTPVNGKIWVFYGATTNVGYTIEVTDTVTGAKKTYESLPGTFCGRADTAAFPADQAASAALAGAPAGATRASEATHQGGGDGPGDAPGTSETLTLLGRFEVGVDFSVQDEQGQTVPGKGKAIPGTDQSGYFWFFREDNLELLVKMVDARSLDGYFWTFVGALSNVAYTVHIHDPVTDQDWEFVNPEGSYCGGYDGHAFFVGD